jgi:predicted patatin/cPLA2 family phospholipase
MLFEGKVSTIVEAMKEKKSLIEKGRADDGPRILFVGCGGVIYGCEGGGTVTAFQEAGYGEVFDWVFGLSTAAPGVTYFLSGNPRLGATIYSEECCSSKFLSPLRLHKPIDTGFLDLVFRGSTGKGFNLNRVFNHRTDLLIGITNAYSGRQKIVRPRCAEELYQALHASISIAGFTGMPVEFGGRFYTDGSMSNPLPVRKLVRQLKPTHILILPHRMQGVPDRPPLLETVLYQTALRQRVPPLMRAMAYRRRLRFKESLRWLREDCEVPFSIAWSEGPISQFERDSSKIKTATDAAERLWLDLLQ